MASRLGHAHFWIFSGSGNSSGSGSFFPDWMLWVFCREKCFVGMSRKKVGISPRECVFRNQRGRCSPRGVRIKGVIEKGWIFDEKKIIEQWTFFPQHPIHKKSALRANFVRSGKMLEKCAWPNLDAMSVPEALVYSILHHFAQGVRIKHP